MFAVRRNYYACGPCGLLREANQASGAYRGLMETSVINTLKSFPPEASDEAMAQSMLNMARLIDREEVNARDVPVFHKELRQTIAQLILLFPSVPEDDETDKAQQRRASVLESIAAEARDWDD